MIQQHPFEPFFDKDSKVLILGTFPSPGSKKGGFYYQHGGNRFWTILEGIFDLPQNSLKGNVEAQKSFLKEKHIALWDIFAECEIEDSKDDSIKNGKPNDISIIVDNAPIKKIILAIGDKMYEKWACKFYEPKYKDMLCVLPSTSSASGGVPGYDTKSLIEKYAKELKKYL